MQTYIIIAILSGLMLLSYIFEQFGQGRGMPTVVLLIAIGLGLRVMADRYGLSFPAIESMLPVIGTIGLVLIVFEGALELEIAPEKRDVMIRALVSAVALLAANVALTVAFLHFWLGAPAIICVPAAIAVSVISSSIAIPSVSHLGERTREFVVYESSISDILGIVLFNFWMLTAKGGGKAIVGYALGAVAAGGFALVGFAVLVLLLERVQSRIKFLPFMAAVMLLYSAGNLLHLPALLLVLMLGLFLNNTRLFLKGRLRAYIRIGALHEETRTLKTLANEMVFFVKTYFFLLFGFSTDIGSLLDLWGLLAAIVIVGGAFVMRSLFLRLALGMDTGPEAFVAPRGLITILLYYKLQGSYALEGLSPGAVMMIVLLSAFLMMAGLASDRSKPKPTT